MLQNAKELMGVMEKDAWWSDMKEAMDKGGKHVKTMMATKLRMGWVGNCNMYMKKKLAMKKGFSKVCCIRDETQLYWSTNWFIEGRMWRPKEEWGYKPSLWTFVHYTFI